MGRAEGDKGLILHIGLTKTATTSIQRSLFSVHPDIYYLGKELTYPAAHGCRSDHVHNMLEPAIFKIGFDFDPEHCKRIFLQTVLPDVSGNQVIVGSWEGIGSTESETLFGEKIKRLLRIFGYLKILVVLRNPYNRLPSQYLQDLRGQFIKMDHPSMNGRAFLEFGNWFKNVTSFRGKGDPFSYGRNIQKASQLIGKTNIGVFLYEQLLNDPIDYYTRICAFLGIDTGEALAQSAKGRFNLRLTERQVNIIRETESNLVRRLLWRIKSKKARRIILKHPIAASGDESKPACVTMSEEIRMSIAERSCKAHRWFMHEFDLDLEKYGYPL